MRRRLAGIHVVLLLVLLAGVAQHLRSIALFTAPRLCSLKVQPQIGLSPLTYIRLTVVIEPNTRWREASVTLFDDVAEITRTTIFEEDPPHRRTTVKDLKNLELTEGTYYLHLIAVGQGLRCDDKTQIEVRGE